MGNEFRVNSYQEDWQREPHVLALRGGGFVITWESYLNTQEDGDPVATYVAAQFYDAAGNRVGGERVMRGLDGSYSGEPHAAQLANGNIVLTWMETDYDPIFTNGAVIKTQVFTAAGAPVSAVSQVDTVSAFRQFSPSVVALANGGFIVSYGADSTDTEPPLFDEVYYRVYGANGLPIGLDRTLNVNSNEFDELITKSARLNNGNSIVIWNSEAAISDGTNDGQNQLRATLFGPNGQVLRADFGLTEHMGGAGNANHYGYSVAAWGNGGFVVSNLNWTPRDDDDGTQGIYLTFHAANGQQVGGIRPVFERGVVMGDHEITRLSNGQYVVTWSQDPLQQVDIADDVYAIVVDANGRPVSQAFEVSVDADRYDGQDSPSIAALAGGGFVISYMSESIDADHEGVAARIFGRGTNGNDRLVVDATGTMAGLNGNDWLIGDGRASWIYGDAGNDTLFGNAGNDILSGGAGNDRLTGGPGVDTLFGGAGHDAFVFTTIGAANADRIGDFANAVGNNDVFHLSRAVFKALAPGALPAADFVLGAAARDASDHIIYNRATGQLFYDANGSPAGGVGLIATLTNKPVLTAVDFVVV